MIGSTRSIRVFAYGTPADMRKGFDGLYGLVREHLKADPLSGDMYLFVSGNRKRANVGPGSFASPAVVRVSPDGVVWTDVEADALRYRQDLSAIAWSGSTLVALGGTYLAASPDGFSWSVTAESATSDYFRLSGVVWTGTKFVVVGSGLGPDGWMEGLVLTSTDGINWIQTHPEADAWFRRIAARGETLFVTGSGASNPEIPRIYTPVRTARRGSR